MAKKKKETLTTASGIPIADNQNSLTAEPRGPLLVQDWQLFEKHAHFNRERIPERVVHAKGSGAYGTLTITHDITKYSKAKVFSEVGKKTQCFLRFSTVAGERARLTPSATCVALQSSFTPRKATGIWWAITLRCSSCATHTSVRISYVHRSAIPRPTCKAPRRCGTFGPSRLKASIR